MSMRCKTAASRTSGSDASRLVLRLGSQGAILVILLTSLGALAYQIHARMVPDPALRALTGSVSHAARSKAETYVLEIWKARQEAVLEQSVAPQSSAALPIAALVEINTEAQTPSPAQQLAAGPVPAPPTVVTHAVVPIATGPRLIEPVASQDRAPDVVPVAIAVAEVAPASPTVPIVVAAVAALAIPTVPTLTGMDEQRARLSKIEAEARAAERVRRARLQQADADARARAEEKEARARNAENEARARVEERALSDQKARQAAVERRERAEADERAAFKRAQAAKETARETVRETAKSAQRERFAAALAERQRHASAAPRRAAGVQLALNTKCAAAPLPRNWVGGLLFRSGYRNC